MSFSVASAMVQQFPLSYNFNLANLTTISKNSNLTKELSSF